MGSAEAQKDCYKLILFSYINESSNEWQGIPMMAIAIPQAPSQYNPVFLTGSSTLYLRSYSGGPSSYTPSDDEKQQAISLNPYFKPSDAIECNDNGCIYLSGIFGGEKNKLYENSDFPYITGIGWNNDGCCGWSKCLEIYDITYSSTDVHFTGKIRYREFYDYNSLSGVINDPGTEITISEYQTTTTSGSYSLDVSVE